MRTVESSTALGMVLAILFDYLCNFFLLFLRALVRIGGAVFDTGHSVLHLRPGLLTVDHDFWLEDNHVVLDGCFQKITNRQMQCFSQLSREGNLKFLFDFYESNASTP
jgi:hypothetical protein